MINYLKPCGKTGVLRYRRVFKPEVRPFVAIVMGRNSITEFKVTLGARSITEPGAMARYEAAHAKCERIIAQARKLATGAYDPLDGPLIAYLAERYRVEQLAEDAAARLDPEVKAGGELLTTAAEGAGYVLPPYRPTARWAHAMRRSSAYPLCSLHRQVGSEASGGC